MTEVRLDTMLSSVGESYEDFVDKFVETHELREYSTLFDALSKTCQKLLRSTTTTHPRGTQNWLEGFAKRLGSVEFRQRMKDLLVELKKDSKGIRRILARDGHRQAREALKQTNKTFDLATEMLGNSTRNHLAGAFKPAPVPAPAPDESVLGSSTALPLRVPLHVAPQKAQYKENVTDQDEPSTKQLGTILGKRDRDQEAEEHDLQRPRAEKDEHVLWNSNTKKSAFHANNLFQSEANHDGDDDEDKEEENIATLFQEQGHHPLNVVFDYEAFAFSCIIGHYDISAPFNAYYEEAIIVPYDHNAFQDSLATAGILFLGKESTIMQRQHFGEYFEKLREVMVEPNKDDEQATADEEDGAVFRKAERKSGSEYARKQLKKRIEEEEDAPLKELYEHAVKLPKECAPMSEADQISSFILGMLRPIFDRPDFSRLAHSMATAATSSSIFVRLCKNLTTSSKNSDFLVRFKECLDIGVAEVSFEASAQKDTGDLCRAMLWSKRVLDEIVTKFESIEQVKLIFFQVVEQTCIFYTMKRADTVCIAMEFAKLKIAYTISDILTDFEDDARDWLLVCRTFDNLVTTLKSAKERKLENPPPPVFVGLRTPRSRHMKKDTRHRP
ncbi:hypothetical protein BGZ51_005375 [Haplosporangium sp. Z 767]|nr:hypothetical protein BGZ51_005375 [Haplosporangium sp. Z 767]KAF9181806.1 hypothetical protein BGZ50_005304 [Haplosporangium sp. Z 11]